MKMAVKFPACHGLSVRVPPGIEVRARLNDAVARFPALRSLRLWIDRIPFACDHPIALDRRARELRRAVGPAGRAVLLCHNDNVRELVVVARRAHLGRAGLDLVAALLTGEDLADAVPEVAGIEPGHWPVAPSVEWGLGDPHRAGRFGTLSVPSTMSSSNAVLIAATGLALGRYGDGAAPRLGVLRSVPGVDDVATATVHLADRPTIGQLLQRAEAVATFEDGAVRHVADDHLPAVGIVLTSCPPAQCYQPFSAPPFPITMHWARHPDGTLSGTCWYDEAAVAPDMAGQFARHVSGLAAQLGQLPASRPVDGVRMLADDEVSVIVAAGTTAPVHDAGTVPIHEMFHAVARDRPDEVAVSDADRSLTYEQLASQSSSVAAALHGFGIGPGCFVGVCLERDADLVVTLLGVLKTGAAYVPMDVRHPADRLRYTTEDAGLALVIGDPALFPPSDGVRVVHPADLRAAPTVAGPAVNIDAAAYVIYTSGSTGRPKGVVVAHRNVAALLSATEDDLGLRPSDVWTLFHSGAFDFSVWEIWGCLLTGGHLVVVPHWVSRSPEEFHDVLVRKRVTVLSQTPSAFAQLLAVDQQREANLAVRVIVFGGEPLDVRMLAPWFRRHPHTRCRLVNMFGITETTVHVTSQTVTPREVAMVSRSVGRALPGWSVSVRDELGELVPFGVAGEIYVGGAGVASHYLNRPALTASRFRADPLTGGRVYRSGDRGRLRPDGRLDHLGRLDDQVKVRGHRIELGEIRSVLQEDLSVRSAAVVLSTSAGGAAAGARLDAYVVLDDERSVADLRRRAARMLPDYMVPSTITALSALPLTINGKVDLRRLPRPVALPAAAPVPTTVDEADDLAGRTLAVWRSILGGELSPDDDFFEVGGNSLVAIQLHTALREAGLPSVPIRELYLNSTVTQYCRFLLQRES